MNIRISLSTFMLLLLVGCGGGSSESTDQTSTSTFEEQQSDSDIAKIKLGDNSIVNLSMEDINLNYSHLSLTLPQNHVSNVSYGSDKITFIRTFYDDGLGLVKFTYFHDFPNNTYAEYELGYDLTRRNFVYIPNSYGIGEMGSTVNLNEFSTLGSMDGVWESDCVHHLQNVQGVVTAEYSRIRRLEISGNNIKITFHNNCQIGQIYQQYVGEFKSQIMHDDFSNREVIVVKDPETKNRYMPPKKFLISSDNKKMIRFFGVNTYDVYHKVN